MSNSEPAEPSHVVYGNVAYALVLRYSDHVIVLGNVTDSVPWQALVPPDLDGVVLYRVPLPAYFITDREYESSYAPP